MKGILFLLFFALISLKVNSQCCCANLDISFIDRDSKVITKDNKDFTFEVKVNSGQKKQAHFVDYTQEELNQFFDSIPFIQVGIACGVDRVEFTITHENDKMILVLQNLQGEINRRFFKVPFVPGTYQIEVGEFSWHTPYTGNDFGLTKLFVGDYIIPFKFSDNKFMTDTSSYFASDSKYWHQRVMNQSPKINLPANLSMKEIYDAYYMILENGDTLINEPYVKFIQRYFGSELKEELKFVTEQTVWDTLQFNEFKEIDTLNDNNDLIENPVGVYILYGSNVVFSKIGEFNTSFINGILTTSLYNGIWYRYDNRRKLVRKEIYYHGVLVGYAAVNTRRKNELLQFIQKQAQIKIKR